MRPVPLAVRLCTLGFLVNFQPSEPYLTQYLLHTKNLTDAQLSTEVWPWSTTGTFVLLLPFALLAELVGARPVILLGLVCRECTRAVLIFADGVAWMAAMQVAYAGGVAANTIYFAYVYSVTPAEGYATMTSLVLASYHAGNVLAALLAQVLVSTVPSVAADYKPLFYISWLFTTLGALAFWLLPPPTREAPPALARELLRHGLRPTVRELWVLYRPLEAHTWLLWWVFGVSGQVGRRPGAPSTQQPAQSLSVCKQRVHRSPQLHLRVDALTPAAYPAWQVVVLNYFQLQLAEVSDTTLYGLLEASLEASLVMGSLLATPLARAIHRRPAAFVGATSALRAAAYALAAFGAGRGWEALPWSMNSFAAALCSLQQAAGSALVATSLVGSNRFALLFSTNTLLANGAAALLGNVGARLSFSTNAYYYAVACAQLLLLLLAPLFAAPGQRGSKLEEQAAAGSADRIVLHEDDSTRY